MQAATLRGLVTMLDTRGRRTGLCLYAVDGRHPQGRVTSSIYRFPDLYDCREAEKTLVILRAHRSMEQKGYSPRALSAKRQTWMDSDHYRST
jgi:hypothetical protein